MTSIRTELKQEAELTTLIVEGKLSVESLIDTLRMFYDNNPTRYLIWDFSHADLSDIHGPELKQIAIESKRFTHLRPNGKTAIVSPRDLAYGLGRQFAVISELHEIPIRIDTFRSVDDALEWLYSDE